MFQKSMRAISLLWKYAPGLTLIKLIQVSVSAILGALSIYFTQRIIDAASTFAANGTGWNSLLIWGLLLLLSMLFGSIGGGFLNGILYIAIRRRLNARMMPDIAEKFKRLDYPCFEDRAVQDTLERMSSDPQEKAFQLFLTVSEVMECSVGIVCAAVIFTQAGWWFVLGFGLLLIPMIWLDFKASDMMNTMINSQSEDERKMHYLGGLLSNKSPLFELKLFRATGYISDKWRTIAHKVLQDRVKTTIQSQKYFLISTILFKCWSAFIIISMIVSVLSGRITIGLFTALITSTGSVLDNAFLLSHSVQNLQARCLLMEHYDRFLSLPEIPSGGMRLSSGTPHIVFDQVVFSYPKTDKKILNGVSFDIREGERVALVGENGAGKSTVIKLLCRLYQPDSGRIFVNGQDLQTLDITELHRVFSVVFQDFCRYSLTLRENVALGDIEKLWDDNALHGALAMGLADGIADLDTPLGKMEDNGIDLSGGQWQRVAVARACLPESGFVILDEPTAALDPVAESEMYKGFAEVLKNRGCMMISHRLASARMADKILVLSNGVVAEAGSHEQLMAAQERYAKMYKAQSAWYAADSGKEGEPV